MVERSPGQKSQKALNGACLGLSQAGSRATAVLKGLKEENLETVTGW